MLSSVSITTDTRQRFIVRAPYSALALCQRIPDRRAWDARTQSWVVAGSRKNAEYLTAVFDSAAWADEARALAARLTIAGQAPAPLETVDHVFAEPPPYAHQARALALSAEAPAFALLMEQRTGKTRVVIDNAAYLFTRSKLDTVFIVCPNSVKDVWAEQVTEWTPRHVPTRVAVVRPGKKARAAVEEAVATCPPGTLLYIITNVDLLSLKPHVAWLTGLLRGRTAMAAVDEATRIKSPQALRTKNLVKLRALFPYRRVLTGSLITQSPLDAYAPFSFLDPAILGYSSFYTFRNDFALMGGWNNRQVLAYVNTDKLAALIRPFSFRVTRDQVWDMPPKLYVRREVELAPEQRRLYDAMRDQMLAELGGLKVSATIVLTQMLRLQQIVGGFVPLPVDPEAPHAPVAQAIPGENAKLIALLEALEEETGKVIIWCRFRPEIALVSTALRARYGDDAVAEFHGGVLERDRAAVRAAFQDPASTVRYLVGNQATGGVGIDLSAAALVVYFSNTFSLEDRVQTEDRAQALKKTASTGYLDLVALDTLDLRVIKALRDKKKLADEINGDNYKEWL